MPQRSRPSPVAVLTTDRQPHVRGLNLYIRLLYSVSTLRNERIALADFNDVAVRVLGVVQVMVVPPEAEVAGEQRSLDGQSEFHRAKGLLLPLGPKHVPVSVAHALEARRELRTEPELLRNVGPELVEFGSELFLQPFDPCPLGVRQPPCTLCLTDGLGDVDPEIRLQQGLQAQQRSPRHE
jgi:hypothetical protein